MPGKIRLQALYTGHELDDLVLEGSAGGSNRTVDMQIRHLPRLKASDPAFVKLVGSFARSVRDEPEAVAEDRLRLALAISDRTRGCEALMDLCGMARASDDPDDFARRLQVPGLTSEPVRKLYTEFALARGAEEGAVFEHVGELRTMLAALFVITFDIEGDQARDAAAVVARLSEALVDRDPSAAQKLFSFLRATAADLAPKAGVVDRARIRRLCATRFALGARSLLAADIERLKEHTKRTLQAVADTVGGQVHIDRSASETDLADALKDADVVIVTGDPGVGKSAAVSRVLRGNEAVFATSTPSLEVPNLDAFERNLDLRRPLWEVLDAFPTASSRVAFIDSAERGLDATRHGPFTGLIRDAARVRWTVVLATRADAMQALRDEMSRILPDASIKVVRVPPLVDGDLEELSRRFPGLRGVVAAPRTKELLRRPFYCDLIVRANAEEEVAAGPVGEAEVADVIWRRLVRLNETLDPERGTPDDREIALLALGKAVITGHAEQPLPGGGTALVGLRRDHLITRARDRDDVAHEVLRDWAAARWLGSRDDPIHVLRDAGWPRPALRATRLWLEALLSQGAYENWLACVREISAEPSSRWADVPFEALVLGGGAHEWLKHLAEAIFAEGLLPQLLGTLRRRAIDLETGAPSLLAWLPVVAFTSAHATRIETKLIPAVIELWRTWYGTTGVPDRFKDQVLGATLRWLGDLPVGPDASMISLVGRTASAAPDQAFEFLEDIVEQAPEDIVELSEDIPAVAALVRVDARRCGELLYRAYCVDKDEEFAFDSWAPPGFDSEDEGVRDLPFGGGALFAWFRGPFYVLLRLAPKEGLRLVGRIVDRATRFRMPIDTPAGEELAPVDIDYPGVGRKRFLGSDQIYRWSRGTGVGPYAAISALLALERWARERISGGDAMKDVFAQILAATESVAAITVCIGLAAEFKDKLEDEIDPFFAEPLLWEYEIVRSVTDGHGIAADRDSHRKLTLHDLAAWTVIRSDTERRERLREIGRSIADRGYSFVIPGEEGPPPHQHETRLWAGTLDIDNYEAEKQEEGVVISRKVPEGMELDPDGKGERAGKNLEAYSLLHTSHDVAVGNTHVDAATLLQNLERANSLASELISEANEPLVPDDAGPDGFAVILVQQMLTAVAAATVVGVPVEDTPGGTRTWCREQLVAAVDRGPQRDPFGAEDVSVFPWAPDRSAAIGLAHLTAQDLSDPEADGALLSLVRSSVYEVRVFLARSLSGLWRSRPEFAERCVVEMVRQSRVARDPNAYRHTLAAFEGNLTDAITEAALMDADLRACAPALTAVGEAIDAEIEIPPSLDNLVAALAKADVRISQETAGKPGWPPAEWTGALASLAVASFSRNDRRLIDFFVRNCEAAPQTTAAICHRMRDRFIGTPDEKVFIEAWAEIVPGVLTSSMWDDAPYLQFGMFNLASALLPTTIKEGRTLVPEDGQDLIEEWTGRFEGHSELVSPLVSYLMAVSADVVLGKGMRWVVALRGNEPNRYDQRSGLGALLDRLSVGVDIRGAPKDAAVRYYRLVDQLAVAGDPDALRAQVRLEQA